MRTRQENEAGLSRDAAQHVLTRLHDEAYLAARDVKVCADSKYIGTAVGSYAKALAIKISVCWDELIAIVEGTKRLAQYCEHDGCLATSPYEPGRRFWCPDHLGHDGHEHVDYAEAADVREIEREMAIEAGDDSELDHQAAEDDARAERRSHERCPVCPDCTDYADPNGPDDNGDGGAF